MVIMEDYDSVTLDVVHQHIINTVIEKSRIDFLKESIGEDVLQKLRAIWEQKIIEENVVPLRSTVPYSSVSVRPRGNCCKKKSTPPKSYIRPYQKRIPTTVDLPICNRNMPLLTFEENEPIPQPNGIVETISKPEEQKVLMEPIKIIEHRIVESIPELEEQKIETNKIIEHGLTMNQNCRDNLNKTLIVRMCRLKDDNNINQALPEPNNNVGKKRGRPRKYPPLTGPRKQRGRPRLLKNILKMSSPIQTKQSIRTKDSKYQHCTIVQTDGISDNPKFKVKPKFTGLPVKVNQKRFEDETELTTDDDLTDSENSSQMFECDNVIHCQYEMVKRVKNKWKINLKCGVMHLKGKDYAFNSASCQVKW